MTAIRLEKNLLQVIRCNAGQKNQNLFGGKTHIHTALTITPQSNRNRTDKQIYPKPTAACHDLPSKWKKKRQVHAELVIRIN